MPESCCVIGCTTRRDNRSRALGIGLFRIPANKRRRAAWVSAISRKKWEPHKWDVVCGRHFVSGRPVDCIEDVDYRPTLLMRGSTSTPTSQETETPRNKRATKRANEAHMLELASVSESKNFKSNPSLLYYCHQV